MDISGMSEEEQLQAAMQLSMQDASSVMGPQGGGGGGAPAPPAQLPIPDRGKQRTFPSKDAQDTLAPIARLSAKKSRTEPRVNPSGADTRLTSAEATELFRLIFGDRPEAADIQRWLAVAFQFSPLAGTEWGLWQRHGGPCGIFAPVQAFMLKSLLFDEGDNAEADAARRQEQPLAATGVEDLRPATLAHALASIVYHATPTSSYAVCQASYPQGVEPGDASAVATAAQSLAVGATSIEVTISKVSRISDVQQAFEEGVDAWLSGPCGVLSFICTVLLSRTPTTVREDMDDPQTPLIGRFGHCSQELVNLMLIGEATSNVFDGSRWLGDDPSSGLLVKGVDADKVGVPAVGFLSELEPMRYVAVGANFKNPDFPMWVLGSPTHYTVLFSTRKADSQLSAEAQLEQRAKKVFMENSIDEGGLALATSLPKLLEGMGVGADRQSEAQRDVVSEEVILWDDFRRWTRRHFGLGDGEPGREACAQSKLRLFIYDGQDPPGPTLRSITVEATDIDPSLAGGESDTFTATLQTRWPNAVVSVKPIAGAAAEA